MNDTVRNSRIHLVMMVYNEEDVIEPVVRENFAYISQFPNGTLIVTEDGSTDQTRPILKRLEQELGFELHSSPDRKGAARAHRDELKIANQGADIVLVTDSDGQHKPVDFDLLLEHIDQYDMVVGRKYPRHDPWARIYGSKLWNLYLWLLFGLRMKDINCGFRAIRSQVLTELLPKNELFPECVLTELSLRAHHAGYTQKSVNISHYWRKSGQKAWNPKRIPKIVKQLFVATLKLRKEFMHNPVTPKQ